MQYMSQRWPKHKDILVAKVVLKACQYFIWMRHKGATNSREYMEYLKLFEILDKKPLLKKCNSCGNTATSFGIFRNKVIAYYLCDDCKVDYLGFDMTYISGIRHYESIKTIPCGRLKNDSTNYNNIIYEIAMAKGAPKFNLCKSVKSDDLVKAFFINKD